MAETLKWGATGATAITGNRFMKRTFAWGTTAQRPAKYPVDGIYLNITTSELQQNTGTFDIPVWTVVIE